MDATSTEPLVLCIMSIGDSVLSTMTIKDNRLALHPAQEDVFYDQVRRLSCSEYNVGGYIAINGSVDMQCLEYCVRKATKAIDVLNVKFEFDLNSPKQVVRNDVDLIVHRLDFSSSPNAEADALKWIRNKFNESVDIYGESLVDQALIKVSDSEVWWYNRSHHTLIDGMGYVVFCKLVAETYSAIKRGIKVDGLDDLPSYLDEVDTQRAFLQSDRFKKSLSYWRDRISDHESGGFAKKDHRPVDGDITAQVSCCLTKELVASLDRVTRICGVSMQQIMILAVGMYSRFIRGVNDVIVGVPVHNRGARRHRNMVGMFAGVLPFVCDFDSEHTIIETLQKISRLQKQDYRHGKVPTRHIMREAMLSLSGRNRLQDVVVSYDLFDFQLDFDGASAKVVQVESDDNDTPLQIRLLDYGDLNLELRVKCHFNYFGDDDAGRALAYLVFILEQLEQSLESPMSVMQHCTQQESQVLINQIGLGSPSLGREVPVFRYIEDVARRYPNKTAVVFKDRSLTYEELEKRSNQLANHLLSLGLERNAIVAICLDRSLETFVAVLAVLKAGAAYLPLDPEYPRARLRFMIEDAGPSFIVTTKSRVSIVDFVDSEAVLLNAEMRKEPALVLIDEAKALMDTPTTNIGIEVEASQLAYIIYTSGSTGRPKGVMLEHGGLTNLALAQSQAFGISENSRVLQFASLSFDASVSEWSTTLSQGATLYLSDNDTIKTPRKLSEYAEKNRITHCTLPPALLSEIDPLQWRSMTHLILAGESCDINQLSRWSRDRIVINAYGPTEATVCATMGLVSAGSSSTHIGRPIAGVYLYIVDDNMNLLPLGSVGELLIGGVGVARGYLGMPQLTSERFITDPFCESLLRRVYRSGDLVRWNEKGNLEFISRVDEQIKIHGYRIETDEIVALLCEHRSVSQAVVMAAERKHGSSYLVAYVILTDDVARGDIGSTLSAYLKTRLPGYMVPTRYIVLESMPLTHNGKVDKRGLPAPDMFPAKAIYIEPETQTEKVTAQIWLDVLEVESVGRDDNFFLLGGDSLAAMKVVNRIYAAMGVKASVQILFDHRTLLSFCLQLDALEKVQEIQRVCRSSPLTLSDGQRRLWIHDRLGGSSAQYNMPAAFSIEGPLSLEVLERTLNAIISRHEVLRTVYEQDMDSAIVLQRIVDGVTLSISCIDLEGMSADVVWEEVDSQLYREATTLFDLSSDLMLRARILKLSENWHVLLITLHHIAADGWSINLLIREMGELYNSYVAGVEPTLDKLPLQYADFAAYMKGAACLRDMTSVEEYWVEQLEGMPHVHSLALDFLRPVKQSFNGALYRSNISDHMLERFTGTLREYDVTLFVGLYAAFTLTLARFSNSSDIVVGTPVGNRDIPGVENVVGLFVDVLVLRTQLQSNMSFADLLRQSNEVFLQANDKRISFESLVDLLQPLRTTSHTPLFQVMLNLHNSNIETLSFPGVEVTMLKPSKVLSKYDLTLNIEQTDAGLQLVWEYSCDLFVPETIRRLAQTFELVIEQLSVVQEGDIWSQSALVEADRRRIFQYWNDTYTCYPFDVGVHQYISLQAINNPDNDALVFNEDTLTYREFELRVNVLAGHLIELGVKRETLVGICIERSVELVVALVAVLKAGGAYVPLDPGYPLERLDYMIEDSGLNYILTQSHVEAMLPSHRGLNLVDVERYSKIGDYNSSNNSCAKFEAILPGQLAYVNYTSGSTGKPKGVLVEHRNLNNFLCAMDDVFKSHFTEHPCTGWLATTSISFDISVLELLWNLKNGRKVVVEGEKPRRNCSQRVSSRRADFSLFYFSSEQEVQTQKHGEEYDTYRLLLEGAEFADQHGFAAVWVPERHFHRFGGIYPCPAVAAAAVASRTRKVAVRAGSVVLPLHDPIQIAEQWSMLDNMSKGRVGMAFASGWHPNDFVFSPEDYSQRAQRLKEGVRLVQRLWSGESVSRKNGKGDLCDVSILPKPVQPHLPIWITSAGSLATFEYAGSIGANILTHLLGQSVEELAEKIVAYRRSLMEHGHDVDASTVTVMLHTFVSPDLDFVQTVVREPFRQYLKDSIDLIKPISDQMNLDIVSGIEEIIDVAYRRYFDSAGMFGTPETCARKIIELQEIGIDEIACLIDFGIDETIVLENLSYLSELKDMVSRHNCQQRMFERCKVGGLEVGELILRHTVSHMQITPSFMNELIYSDIPDCAWDMLEGILLGGEAWPKDLPAKLKDKTEAKLFNMYGPTETTVWSSVKSVTDDDVRIGGPIANTRFYVLNEFEKPVPIGVFGELYIGGHGVARGYLNKQELTTSRFLVDPFCDEAGARMYRTGDLVRWLPSGELEFAGRIDNQVKIRGFRIELEEIESGLLSHPQVLEAVVVARKSNEHDIDLVAYIVADPDATATLESEDLRQHLAAIVPDYMLPSMFISIDEVPLTPNGKVDRKALPSLDEKFFQKEYVAPRNALETALCDIFQDILPVENVGVSDSFFLLGGNSLLALRLINRVRDTLNVVLEIEEFFRNDTVENIARVVGKQRVSEDNRRLQNMAENVAEVEW